MDIGICYKGVFNINYIRQYGVDKYLLNKLDETIKNHNEMIYDELLLYDNKIDTFMSSYNINDKLNSILVRDYKSKKYTFTSQTNISSNTWVAQLNHLNILISMIIEEEKLRNKNYDYFIFTRFDIFFHKKYDIFNIDLNKFNITVEHPSGNCDDNLWIFPRKYLDIFQKSINELLIENKMTHEINHKILKFGGDINYIDNLIDSYMGHTIFSFVR